MPQLPGSNPRGSSCKGRTTLARAAVTQFLESRPRRKACHKSYTQYDILPSISDADADRTYEPRMFVCDEMNRPWASFSTTRNVGGFDEDVKNPTVYFIKRSGG